MFNKGQKLKIVEGYNKKVQMVKDDVSDRGKTPFHANSYSYVGYEKARGVVLRQQVQGIYPIVLEPITIDDVEDLFKD